MTPEKIAERRAELEEYYGEVYNTAEVTAAFEIRGFGGGIVVVVRKADMNHVHK